MLKKTVSVILTLLLTGSTPGFEFWRALAETVRVEAPAQGVGPVNVESGEAPLGGVNIRGPLPLDAQSPISMPPAERVKLSSVEIPKVPDVLRPNAIFKTPATGASNAVDALRQNADIRELTRPANPRQAQNLDALYDESRRVNLETPVLSADVIPSALRKAASAFGSVRVGFAKKRNIHLETDPDDVWALLQNQVLDSFGIALDSKEIKQWQSATAAILKDEPSLAIEQALAQALGKIRALPPEKVRQIYFGLATGAIPFIQGEQPRGPWFIKAANGRVLVGAENGLFELKDGVSLPISQKIQWVETILQSNGKILVGADKGLFELRRKILVPIQGLEYVYALAQIDGRILIGTNKGLFELLKGVIVPVRPDAGNIRTIVQIKGRILVGAVSGLFELQGNKLIKLGKDLSWVQSIASTKDRILVAAAEGLYELRGSALVPINEQIKFFRSISLIEKRVLIAGGNASGFFELKGNSLEPIQRNIGHPRTFTSIGGEVLAGTDRGVFRLLLHAPSGWQDGLLKTLVEDIESTSKTRAENPSSTSIRSDGGQIVDGNGRSIFSGLQRGRRVVRNTLSKAATLAGKAASAFGSSRLGFAGKIRKDNPVKPDAGPWKSMLDEIRDEFGWTLEDGFEKHWKVEAAEILRNEPTLPIEKALAQAFANIRLLTPAEKENLQKLLYGNPLPIFPGHGNSIFGDPDTGRVYVGSEDSFLYEAGGKWRVIRVPSAGRVLNLARFNGKRYVGTEYGVFVEENRRWIKIFSKQWCRIAVINGKLHAGTAWGIYVQDPRGEWSRDTIKINKSRRTAEYDSKSWVTGWNTFNGVTYARVHNHSLYSYSDTPFGPRWILAMNFSRIRNLGGVAYGLRESYHSPGFFRFKDGKWEDLFVSDRVKGAAIIDGRISVVAEGKLKKQTGKGWKSFLPKIDEIDQIAESAGNVYLKTGSGILRLSAVQRSRLEGWPEMMNAISLEVLEEAGRMHRSSSKSSLQKENPAPGDSAILGQTGRTVFTGFRIPDRLKSLLGSLNLAFSKTGGANLPKEKDEDLWSILNRWVEETIGLKTSPSKIQEWKRRTAELLRSNPAVPLERALAEAMAQVNDLGPGPEAQIESLLAKGFYQGLQDNEVYWSESFQGEIFSATDNGIYRQKKGDWIQELSERAYPLKAYQLKEIDGKLYAAASSGVYRRSEDGKWERLSNWPTNDAAISLTQAAGKVYASSRIKIFVREGATWKFLPGIDVQGLNPFSILINRIFELDGKLAAGTNQGLFVLNQGKWETVYRKSRGINVHNAIRANGEILVAVPGRGLLALKPAKGRLAAADGDVIGKAIIPGGADYVTAIDGLIYATAFNALYIQEPGGKFAFRRADFSSTKRFNLDVNHVMKHGGATYISTGEGLRIVASLPQELPADWRDQLFQDIDVQIGEMQESASEASAPAENQTAQQGDKVILNGQGRTIFSGLRIPARLKSLLGNLSLSFASSNLTSVPRPGTLSETKEDIWQRLETENQKELNLQFKSNQSELWAQKTADILRNRTNVSPLHAAAEAFVQVHGLNTSQIQEIESVMDEFSGKPIPELDGYVGRILGVNGVVYATKGNEVYFRRARSWKKLFDISKGWIRDLIEFEGKLYAAAAASSGQALDDERGLWVWDLKKGEKSRQLEFLEINRLVPIEGKLWAATEIGLMAKTKNDHWLRKIPVSGKKTSLPVNLGAFVGKNFEKEYSQVIDVLDAVVFNGEFYLAVSGIGGNQVYRVQPDGKNAGLVEGSTGISSLKIVDDRLYGMPIWRVLSKDKFEPLPGLESVAWTGKINDKHYAVAGGVLYEKDSNLWIPVGGLPKRIRTVFQASEEKHLYLGTSDGVYRWHPNPLMPDLEDQITKDLNRRIALAQKKGELAQPPPKARDTLNASAGSDGQILNSKGRTIFSGLRIPARLKSFFGSLTLGFASKGGNASDRPDDIWVLLDRQIRDALQLAAEFTPGQIMQWRRKSAERLRNDPALPLERALAQGYAEVRLLPPQSAENIEGIISEKGIPLPAPKWQQFTWKGKLHAVVPNGVMALENGAWKMVLPRPPEGEHTDYFGVFTIDKKIFAVVDYGMGMEIASLVYLWKGNRWKPVGLPPDSYRSGFSYRGKAYLSGGSGLYVSEDGENWKKVWKEVKLMIKRRDSGGQPIISYLYGSQQDLDDKNRELSQDPSVEKTEMLPAYYEYVGEWDGRILIRSERGLFAGEDDHWELLAENPKPELNWYAAVIEGTPYAITKQGTFKYSEGRLAFMMPPPPGDPNKNWSVLYFKRVNGHFYAAKRTGIYAQDGNEWHKVWDISINRVQERDDGTVYLITESGALSWNPSLQRPEHVRERLAESLNLEVSKLQTSQVLRPTDKPVQTSTDGAAIVGKDGKTIFSGFQQGRRFVSNTLRKAAEALGNRKLGFGVSNSNRVDAEDIWPILQKRVCDVLQIKIDSEEMKRWHEMTVEILRNDSSLPLETALAQALVKAKVLTRKREEQVREALIYGVKSLTRKAGEANKIFKKEDGKILLGTNRGLFELREDGPIPIKDVGWVHAIVSLNDTILVGAKQGLFELKKGVLVPIGEYIGVVRSIVSVNGRILVGAENGLFELQREGLVLIQKKFPPVRTIVSINGRVLVGTEKGLFELKGNVLKPIDENIGWVWTISVVNDRILVAGDRDLFELKGNLLVPIQQRLKWIPTITAVKDRILVGTQEELFELKGNVLSLIKEDIGWVSTILPINGRILIAAKKGLFELRGDTLLPVPLNFGDIRMVAQINDRTIIGADNGFSELLPPMPVMWQDKLLSRLAPDIEMLRSSESQPSQKIDIHNEGNQIIGKDGRAIFSGFRIPARLKSLFGSSSLSFAKKTDSNDIWTLLDERIREAFQLKSGFDPEIMHAWKQVAAAILRNDPAISVEKAVALAYSKVCLLNSTTSEEIERFLSGEGTPLPEHRVTWHLFRWNHEIHALTSGGIYALRNGSWEHVMPLPVPANQASVFLMEGKLYITQQFMGAQLYRWDGAKWQLLLDAPFSTGIINGLTTWKNKIYMATSEGIYELDEKGHSRHAWEDHRLTVTYRNQPTNVSRGWQWQPSEKKSYRFGSSEILEKIKKEILQKEDVVNAWISPIPALYIGEWNNRLLIATQRGFYWGEGDQWELLYEFPNPDFSTYIQFVDFIDHEPYVLSKEGKWYVLRNRELVPVFPGLVTPQPDFPSTLHFAKYNENFYVVTRSGIFTPEKRSWRRVSSLHTNQVNEENGDLWLLTNKTFVVWNPNRDFPGNWKDQVTKDLENHITEVQASANPSVPQKPLTQADDGRTILNGNGKTIFSGLGVRGRLKSFLGSRTLSFSTLTASQENNSQVANESRSLPADGNIWTSMEQVLQKDLGLKLKPGQTEAWAQEAARMLRSEPTSSLLKVLAEAFIKVYELNAGELQKVESFLKREPVTEIPTRSVYNWKMVRVGKFLYGILAGGLYKQEQGTWKLVRRPPNTLYAFSDIIEFKGDIYIAGLPGVLVWSKGKWSQELDDKVGGEINRAAVYSLAKLNGVLYAAMNTGLFARQRGEWKQILTDWVRDIKVVNDRLHIITHNNEVLQLQPDGSIRHIDMPSGTQWKLVRPFRFNKKSYPSSGPISSAVPPGRLRFEKEFYSLGFSVIDDHLYVVGGSRLLELKGNKFEYASPDYNFKHIAKVDGRRYAIGDWDKLYAQENARWHRVLIPGVKEVSFIAQEREHEPIYIGTKNSFGLARWFPDTLPDNWESQVTGDLSRRIGQMQKDGEAAQPPPEKKADTPVITDNKGRTIFSAFKIPARLKTLLGSMTLGFAKAKADSRSKRRDPPQAYNLPLEQQLDAYLKKYKVPQSEWGLRKRLTLEAIDRIKMDIPLLAGTPHVTVRYGEWWMMVQYIHDRHLKEIVIPVEDIFVRAVDAKGVEECVAAAAHEAGHYLITRVDSNDPFVEKYIQGNSPPENNALYQAMEDTRNNTWVLLKEPGLEPYYDALYDAEWPADPQDKFALQRARMNILASSTIEIEAPKGKKTRWIPPHIQYVDSIIYHWRHKQIQDVPFLTDPLAKEVFEETKPSLERIRNIHPQEVGGILMEPMVIKAWRDAMQAIDSEIYPHYQKLVKESQKQLQQMIESGAKITVSNKGGKNSITIDPKDPNLGEKTRKILDEMSKDISQRIQGNKEDKNDRPTDGRTNPESSDPGNKNSEDTDSKDPGHNGDEESWSENRKKAIEENQALKERFTTYERYRLRAKELGLIDKVDGVIKKILLPTTHVRLSRNHYHEGDEPDLDKHLNDIAQGHLDTPVMRIWNRRIRRTAKIGLVLDISGSMGTLTEAMTSKLDYALLGIIAWVEVCQKNNIDFELLLFDHSQHPIHRYGKTLNRQGKDQLVQDIIRLSGGTTAIGAAFKKSLDSILKQRATHRFIIFATDEEHNTGESPETWMPEAKKNGIVTIAMVIGGNPEQFKHFDYAVRVDEPKDFPVNLLDVLKKAIRSILGPMARWVHL